MTSSYQVLHDPDGVIEAQHPLDRETHQKLVREVLSWCKPEALPADDYQQVALQLTGYARCVSDDLRRLIERTPGPTAWEDRAPLLHARYILDTAQRVLAMPLEGTLWCARDRARAVRDLYARLDQLKALVPSVTATASAH